jgi:predicted AlkP superfamily pyrophosphatase or phosphodiesterase
VLAEKRFLATRMEMGHVMLDPGASAAFAVVDHQIAHVYVNDQSRLGSVKELLEHTPGVARVLDDASKREMHLDHERSGDLICLAEPDAWFTYYFWGLDTQAPDYARTVDIHRKPGYDPVELFINPKLPAPKLTIGLKLLARRLGFRSLLDVIPLDATLVKGSHGLAPRDAAHGPLLVTNQPQLLDRPQIQATDVCGVILRHLDDRG